MTSSEPALRSPIVAFTLIDEKPPLLVFLLWSIARCVSFHNYFLIYSTTTQEYSNLIDTMNFRNSALVFFLALPAVAALDKPKSHVRRASSSVDMEALHRELQFIPGYENQFATCEPQMSTCTGNQVPYEEWASMLEAMDGGEGGALMEVSEMVALMGNTTYTQDAVDISVRDAIASMRDSIAELESMEEGDVTANQISVTPIIQTIVTLGSTLGIDLSILSVVGQVADDILTAIPGGPTSILQAVANSLFTYAGPLLLSLLGGLFGGDSCDEAMSCIMDDMIADIIPDMAGAAFSAQGYAMMEAKEEAAAAEP